MLGLSGAREEGVHIMLKCDLKAASIVAVLAAMPLLASCTQEKTESAPAPPRTQSKVTTQPGIAGGVVEDVFISQTVVSAIDQPSRRVTLKNSAGDQFTFTAPPEVKNLPQVQMGDKVTATFARRLAIIVRADDAAPGASGGSTRATALPGSKPGMLAAEESEVVATVKSIDPVARTAVLEFADGETRSVPVRSDVDLSRYKAGDKVIIRVTVALTVLVETP
jgi:hypothetical protein